MYFGGQIHLIIFIHRKNNYKKKKNTQNEWKQNVLKQMQNTSNVTI